MTDTTVNNGQTVNNLDITNGNFVDVLAGGTANNTTIENGGFLAVEATSGGILNSIFGPKNGGVANAVTVNNGGILELRGNNSSASNIVLNGGSVTVDTTASVTGSLTFGTTTTQTIGVTLDGNDGNFKPTIIGFSASSSISDNAVQFPGATLTSSVSNGNTIATLSGNGVTNTFTFAGTPQLMIVPDNGNDAGPNAVIVTTNTTTNFSALPDIGQVSQSSTAGAQQASAPVPVNTVSAFQTGHESQPAMTFLSQAHGSASAGSSPFSFGTGATTHGQAATAADVGTLSLSSTAHEMAVPHNQGLAGSILGVLSQPQQYGAESAMVGFLSRPMATASRSAGALVGVPQHVATAAVTHTPLHIG